MSLQSPPSFLGAHCKRSKWYTPTGLNPELKGASFAGNAVRCRGGCLR